MSEKEWGLYKALRAGGKSAEEASKIIDGVGSIMQDDVPKDLEEDLFIQPEINVLGY